MRGIAGLLLLLGNAVGCACGSASSGSVRYVVSQGAFDCESGEPDENLATLLNPRALAAALPAEPARADSKQALLDLVACNDPRPLVIFYAGHGTDHRDPARGKEPDQSALCFGDGQLPVDQLLASINPHAASATLVLDACYTAREDVRLSPVPTAVLSGSDRPVTTTGTGTAMTALLVDALQHGDNNQEGIVDDGELLRAVLRGLNTNPRLEPRLRRQSFSALPVVVRNSGFALPRVWPAQEAVRGPAKARILAREQGFSELKLQTLTKTPRVFWAFEPGSSAQLPSSDDDRIEGSAVELGQFARGLAATEGFLLKQEAVDVAVISLRSRVERLRVAPSELPAVVARFERGEWATLTGNGFVWTAGYLAGDITTWNGTHLRATTLQPWPCAEPFGQCFRIALPARTP